MIVGSPLHEVVLAIRKNLKYDFELLSRTFDMGAFSYQEFVNSKMAVDSRGYTVKIKGESTMVLVPFADMLNHSGTSSQAKWYYDEKLQGFCVKAEEDIARGDQIYQGYGEKSNATFFLRFGFLMPENEQNSYAIKILLEPTDPQYQIKGLLAPTISPGPQFSVVGTLDDPRMLKFISWCRFVVFDSANDIDDNTKD
jgi:hypothetical protein